MTEAGWGTQLGRGLMRLRVNGHVDLVGLDTGDPLVCHNRLAELLSRLERTL